MRSATEALSYADGDCPPQLHHVIFYLYKIQSNFPQQNTLVKLQVQDQLLV